MIPDQTVEKALEYLRDTAEEHAKAKALSKFMDHKRKVVRGEQFLEATGTVAEREAKAESSQAYQTCLKELRNAAYDYELLDARREQAKLNIEVWRTEEASRRSGHV